MSDGFTFQASVKDADGDMVNVRAYSVEELEANLLSFPAGAYAQFKANVRGGQALGGMVQSAPQAAQQPPQQAQAGNGWGNPPQQQSAPQNGGAATHPEGKQCGQCGTVLQYKVVTRRSDQKQFKFWACPEQRNRDDGHSSEFA